MRLSVVIPNFNHARFLSTCLNAIFSQALLPDEVIVVDDASTDDSANVIRRFALEHPQLRFIQNLENRGVVATLNKGLSIASGTYVHCAGADDVVLPGFYEQSMRIFEQHPTAGLCSTLSALIDAVGCNQEIFPSAVVAVRAGYFSPNRVLLLLRRYGSWFMGNTVIYRREAMKAAGFLRTELHSYSDGFLDEVLALEYGACFLPNPLVAWRRMTEGYSSTIASQSDRVFEIIRHAENAMQTQYAASFPSNYVKLWKRRQLFSLLQRQTEHIRLGRSTLDEIELNLPDRCLSDRLFFILFKWSFLPQRLLVRLFCLGQKTLYQEWDALRRKLNKVFS